MPRGPKPAKSKEAKLPVARKSANDDGARIRDLEKRLAEALRDKAEALQRETGSREQQSATSEILRVISSSPSDVAPVFTTIARNAMHLLGGVTSGVVLVTGDVVHFGASATRETIGPIGSLIFPMSLSEFSRHRPVLAQVLETRQPASVADMETDERTTPEVRQFARAVGFRSNVIVPMLREGELIGLIVVTRVEPRATRHDEMALLQTFADQAVIAIENVRLFNETKEALEQQTATSEILRVIASSPTDVQPVFDAIASSAARLCRTYDVYIRRLDEDGLRLVAHHGPIAAALLVPVGPGLVSGRAVRERRTVHVVDVQAAADEFPEGARLGEEFGHRTTLCVPLLREGVPLGVIGMRRAERNPFTDHEIALLQTFADQAVIAIENVRLFTELQERNIALTTAHAQVTESLEQQTATSEILRVISQSPTDVQPVFDAIVASATRLCDAGIGAVVSFDGELMHLQATRDWTPEFDAAIRPTLPAPPSRAFSVGRAILERTVVHVPDVELDAEYMPEFIRLAGFFRSVLAVPMLRDGVPLGAITVGRAEPRPFADNQIALLKTFADQAVIAIENVRLFTELQEKNQALTTAHAQVTESLERQTATSEILRVISSSPTDLQPVFDAIVESAARLCQAAFGTLHQFDGQALTFEAQHGMREAQLEPVRNRLADTGRPAARCSTVAWLTSTTSARTRSISSGRIRRATGRCSLFRSCGKVCPWARWPCGGARCSRSPTSRSSS
jgi:GAF domain-containing protein